MSNHLRIFSLREALQTGLTRRTISKKVSNGEFLKIGHGIYLNTQAKIPFEYIDFILAHHKFGSHSIIGGLSALFYHGLIEQAPQQIWVIVPQNIRTKEQKYRLIRTKIVSEKEVEITRFFRITNLNRSIVEAFQYSSKIGIRQAIFAIVKEIGLLNLL